jgi:pimeloyl-ACP methyl ester carboxylesterase
MTPAYLDHFDSQKITVVLNNGLALSYMDVGSRERPPVVLIHGYTDSARDWAPIAPLLNPHFRLIIVDLRGHGGSAKPDCCYTRFDFAHDIKLLLDALGIPAADVVGHSLGSVVAQTFAEEWPAATRRLVLISSTGTAFGGTEPSAAGWLAAVAHIEDPIDPDSQFMRSWWHESTRFNPEFARRQRHDAAAIPAQVWRAIAAQSLTGVDLRSALWRVRAPTLLIWGGRDTLVTEAGRDALRSGIPHAEARTFVSLGHDLFWEDPQAVASLVIGFLQKR